jgi:hypothetical protein
LDEGETARLAQEPCPCHQTILLNLYR